MNNILIALLSFANNFLQYSAVPYINMNERIIIVVPSENNATNFCGANTTIGRKNKLRHSNPIPTVITIKNIV